MSAELHSMSLSTATGQVADYDPLIRLWMLRLLSRTSAGARIARRGLENDDIAYFLGYEPSGKGNKVKEFTDWCHAAIAKAEAATPEMQGVLFDNIHMLSGALGLAPAEEEVIAFKALSVSNSILAELMFKGLGGLSENQLARALSVALGRKLCELERAMRTESALFSSGLLALERGIMPYSMKVGAQPGLINSLLSSQNSMDDLIAFATNRTMPPALRLEDFPHLAQDADVLRRFLSSIKQDGLAGVNILLHGQPGVGKTEFVKSLAAELGMRLYEVGMTGADGEALNSQERMAAYRFNQKVFARDREVLVLFDEIEDVFPSPRQKPDRKEIDKAWVNRLLEANPVPSFWLSNSIWQIDPAHLRRFDYVIEVTNPPRSVRRGILATELRGLPVTETALTQQVEREHFTPALAGKMGRVLQRIDLKDADDADRCLDRLVTSHIEAQGHGSGGRYPVPGHYRLEYLNTNVDVTGLATRLATLPQANLLLYGPPGCGKTAYAHELARSLDRPLLVRRASDLQSMWVGETEKNLARMFREANTEGAVLLLDEADSFLQDRRGATRSWEVSQVNELLTQMECFEGIFLCATNFLDRLDGASLRRFGLKVQFDYLTTEQRIAFFGELVSELGIAQPDDLADIKIRRTLAELTNLTPGDFAAVRKRWYLIESQRDPLALLEAVGEESSIKPDGQKRAIGFSG